MSTVANSQIEVSLKWKLAEDGTVYQNLPPSLPIPCSFFCELTATNLGNVEDNFGFKVLSDAFHQLNTELRLEPGESKHRDLLGHIAEGIEPGQYPVTVFVDLPTVNMEPDPVVMPETYVDTVTVLPAVLPGLMPIIEDGRIIGVTVTGDIMKVACEVDIFNPNSFVISGGDPDQARLDIMISPRDAYEGWLPNFYRNFSASISPGLNTYQLWCDGNISGCSPMPVEDMDVTLTAMVFIFGWINNPMVQADFDTVLGGSSPPLPNEDPVEGDTKCVGSDLWTYTGGQWVLTEENSATCGFTPGDDESVLSSYWKYLLAGGAILGGLALVRRK